MSGTTKRNNGRARQAEPVHPVYGLEQIERATRVVDGRVIGQYREYRLDSHFQPIFSASWRPK